MALSQLALVFLAAGFLAAGTLFAYRYEHPSFAAARAVPAAPGARIGARRMPPDSAGTVKQCGPAVESVSV